MVYEARTSLGLDGSGIRPDTNLTCRARAVGASSVTAKFWLASNRHPLHTGGSFPGTRADVADSTSGRDATAGIGTALYTWAS